MTCLTVGTKDFRQALLAVAPHASVDPDDTALHRLRLQVGPVNLSGTAPTGYTVGHAIVSVVDNHDGEAGVWDLSPVDVKELLGLFKTGKATEADDVLRLAVTEEHVTVTDCSGLFDGKALQLVRYPTHESWPDVAGLLSRHLDTSIVGEAPHAQLVANSQMLAAFNAAGRAYIEPLGIVPVGSPTPRLLITCGESFIGLLMTMRIDPDQQDELRNNQAAWVRRLPAPHPAAWLPRGEEPDDPARADPDPDDPSADDDPGDPVRDLSDNVRSLRDRGVHVTFTPATD